MGSVRLENYEDTEDKKSSVLDELHYCNSKQKFESANRIQHKTKLVEIDRVTIQPTPYIRAVTKTGEYNIYPSKVLKAHFVRDIFTTLLDLKWRYTLTIFTLGFLISWTLFAILWWLIALYHGDLEEHHLPMHQAASNWTPCVTDIYDFTSCFLFSVETQQTTGYGEKRPTEKCPDAVLLMCIQNVIGLIVDASLVGVFFAKLVRPKKRAQTIKFSKFAVISTREDVLCLIFRIGDMREKSRIIEAKVKAQIITQKMSKEGEVYSNYLTKLPINIDDCDSDLLFIWPMTVVHKITSTSPLYNISKENLGKENFEIVVSLEGTIESTDQKMQARSSYLANEILWGHRFEPIISVCRNKGGYKLDYSKFDKTIKDTTSEYSAADINNSSNYRGTSSKM